MSENNFLPNLLRLDVPIFTASPRQDGFTRPYGWEQLTSDGNLDRLACKADNDALMALCGDWLAVVDVDPRNGGNIEAVRTLLSELNVRIFAEVNTPGGGKHFYVAGHPDLATKHLTAANGWPGVDVISHGANVFLPGTLRHDKGYGGKGYTVVFDNLAALADGGDPDGAEALADWACQFGTPVDARPADPLWTGGEPEGREKAYLAGALRSEIDAVANQSEGGRNVRLNDAAFKLGQLVAGAGLPVDDVIAGLRSAALSSGLPPSEAEATIRSGLRAGMKLPRAVPDEDDLGIAVLENNAIPIALDEADAVFTKWLGDEYDLDALHAVLAAAACSQLGGDPLWLMLVSGSGNAKTETVQALSKSGAHVTSTITSEGALLSGTPKREKNKSSTGGLLRQLGDSGILVVKDVTSILSMNRDARAAVLAALREVYDGKWERNIGSDGGQTLTWTGRLAFIGAVTTAWDKAHSVIASMGDRFVLLRMDSTESRMSAGRNSIRNTGSEVEMRDELADAVAGVLAGVDKSVRVDDIREDDVEMLLTAANLVTWARTAVDFDYQGNVEMAHMPEMPTRFAKELAQVMLGGLAIGMTREAALDLALRCAADSMPPIRLAILNDLLTNPDSTSSEVARRVDQPRKSVDRQLQALDALQLLTKYDYHSELGEDGHTKCSWRYTISQEDAKDGLATLARNVSTHNV
ncbi:bifunctional DNA primase/polymerase [Rhodococcus sp. IEGM 1351]|uniref:bifunctional DNA primase/polymerase n=1 Tax=Rhodococcus sp. IEGM 1351 TaxID=3047089 RepID=UPI0024B85B71|nr:bifunctional DNA primase/polymerase [Rhodococcus sp. IEGM 1351]MDI9936582.1 bifunctional DNA primase/polymerase [Rhodococcus sp. IEGM 1351]